MSRLNHTPRIVWAPMGGSQALALTAPANHVLYDGTRGPGKTDTQLMRFRKRVGQGYGKFWNGVIFDRVYKNLEDLIAKSQRWFTEFGDGAKFTAGGGGGRWTWPTGERLVFRHIKKPADYWNYHGHEYPFIGWNELTKYPTSELYDLMMSCNRSSFRPEDYPRKDGTLLPEIPLEVFATTNPFGVGHRWVKKRFIDVAPPGQIVRNVVNVFNPRTQTREDVVKSQVRIFGSYKENRYLSPEYVAELELINDPNKRRAWLYGDWDIAAGFIFDDLWNEDTHVLPRFKIPASWYVDRSFDWGSSHPFSVCWWAEASGEEAYLPDGSTFCPPRGTLIMIDEWYGGREIGSNKGLRLSAAEIAKVVVERDQSLYEKGWIRDIVHSGPADNQIRDVRERDVDTIEKKMGDEGCFWEESDKSAGSRINGVQLMRDRLESSVKCEGPGFYVMRNCQAAIDTIPFLPPDEDNPDDVDTTAEDHVWDATRYRILASSNRASAPRVKFPT